MSASKLSENAKGVYIIAATPFTDEGALDLQSVDTLTDFYLGCGVHGFTLLGMMGEAHKLTADESLDVVKRVVGRAGDRHAACEQQRPEQGPAEESCHVAYSCVLCGVRAGLR